MIPIISFVLCAIFLAAYSCKILMLRIKGIRGYQLARHTATKVSGLQERIVQMTSFAGVALWIIETTSGSTISALSVALHGNRYLAYTGIAITASGVALFCIAMAAMKNSWRVGIDPGKRTRLVETGVYALSRNPAFIGFTMMFAGVLLTYPDVFTAIVFISNTAAIHALVLKEEEHWVAVGGKEYERYRKKTPRYLFR